MTIPNDLAITPELRAELLDPESWAGVLNLYAHTMRVAVALVDTQGQLVGTCHNPQPIWSLAREARPEWGAGCPFCLELDGRCTAAADAVRTDSLALAHDQGGFAHVASPLSLQGQHLGTLIAGQVFDRYPEPLPLERVARQFGLSQQQVWHLAREQAPISRAQLTVYGDLLCTLGQAFLRQRYSAVLERELAETTNRFNKELGALNAQLNRKVVELDFSNTDLQNLFDSSPVATIFLDRELRIKSFTPSVEGVLRLAQADIGRRFTDVAPLLAEAGLAEPIDEILRTLSFGSVEERRLHRGQDGAQATHYLMRILPYRTVHHAIDGVVITFVDVTLLTRAERILEEAKVYAENIVETVREPLLVLDDNLHVKSANSAFYKKFQVTVNETEGQALFDLGNGEWDIPDLRRLLGELLPSDRNVEDFAMEHTFARIGPRSMVLNASRIDHVQLILLAIEDVTERKRAEDSLQRLNLDLKNFTYAASHDLQEPLRMVVSYTQLLAREYQGKLDPQADQFIAYAVEGGQRMERLLRALRDYWLVTERQLDRRTSVDCGRVIGQVLKTLQISIRESGAVVNYGSLPAVLVEEVSLAMLFQNLLGNAIKYRQVGEPPCIHISAQKNAAMWRFAVKDNGIGIEEAHLEEIFAPFKRLHGTEYPGTGIGLALCQKIVERYGGRIWVESTYGQGSTFCFTIPT
ncbi:MAG: ATP-binding protein [Acidobacteriota bacterium]|nr:ATP-binding protein [Acidobacteriota bacterium]